MACQVEVPKYKRDNVQYPLGAEVPRMPLHLTMSCKALGSVASALSKHHKVAKDLEQRVAKRPGLLSRGPTKAPTLVGAQP